MSKSALKILETAEMLFNQNSFNSVGVDLIRDQSGCSKTTLYTYYKNKSQLIGAVLSERDLHFKHSLFNYLDYAQGQEAIHKILDWHIQWFKEDTFKGCLFVRAVAESNTEDQTIIMIAQHHKQWIKELIWKYCPQENRPLIAELIYTLIEGLISRFLVDGYNETVVQHIKISIDKILFCFSDIKA